MDGSDWMLEEGIIYLASCGRYPLLKSSLAQGIEEMQKKAIRPHSIDYTSVKESARIKVATFLGNGCAPERVLFFPCVSQVVTNVLRAFDSSGDAEQKCLVVRDDIESIVVPAQMVFGAQRLVVAPTQREVIALLERDDQDIGVVACGVAFWTTGVMLDVERLVQLCSKKGAKLLLDVSQSLGVYSVPLERMESSLDHFVVCAAVHKHLMGLYGTALAYVSKATLGILQSSDFHTKGVVDADSWDLDGQGMTNEGYPISYSHRMKQLESGQSNPVGFRVLCDALDRRMSFGSEDMVQMHLRKLTTRAKEIFGKFGPIQGDAVHFFSVKAPHSTYEALRAAGVIVDWRHGAIRVSLGLYNTEREMQDLAHRVESLPTNK